MPALPMEKIMELLNRVLTSPSDSMMLAKCWMVKATRLQAAIDDQAGVQDKKERRQHQIGQQYAGH